MTPAWRRSSGAARRWPATTIINVYLTVKGSDARLRAEGVERFRKRVARSRPDYADRVSRLESMDEVHLLHVRFDRLKRWHLDGLLLIGDAAHAITPR
ncbi:FAD-dependent monooxygenase [Nonomuraea salmonea]|uniref:FAD-dependent monooxygenase n=1 Tax=Nonomuraea salmonea TaxID=46181 RepID=A0ABV5P1Y2_9ACTN